MTRAMVLDCFHAQSSICFVQDFEVWNLADFAAAGGAARHVAERFRTHLREETLTVEVEEEGGPGPRSMCVPPGEG